MLDRSMILTLAAAYNGQTAPRGIEDLAANQTYNEVVYHLYHRLNFALLERHLATEAQ
jgi:hypothetical protein